MIEDKLVIMPRAPLEQYSTHWFPKQDGHLSHYLQTHISRTHPRDSDSTDVRRDPRISIFSKHLYDSSGAGWYLDLL